MARGESSPGLTIGQVLSLTLGFLAASVLIFVFGLWVGRDLAEQRLTREAEIVRIDVSPPTPDATLEAAAVAATPTSVQTATVPPTRTPFGTVTPTRAPTRPTTLPTRTAARTPGAAAGGWTVQAGATADPVQAVMLARRLRGRGYDAYTTQKPIAGVTWYRVQVGRFPDRGAAKVMEARLRREEGLEAAYVTQQESSGR